MNSTIDMNSTTRYNNNDDTLINWCKNFLAENNIKIDDNAPFHLDDSVERMVVEVNDEEDEAAVLREKIKSLETKLAKVEEENRAKKDELVAANTKIDVLEKDNSMLQQKLMLYSATVKKLRSSSAVSSKAQTEVESKAIEPGLDTIMNKSSNENILAPGRNRNKKCQYENTGNCRKKNCKDAHPKSTCKQHSKFGTCPFPARCEDRHPNEVCYYWQRFRSCRDGENCRRRHPDSFTPNYSANYNYHEPFLWAGHNSQYVPQDPRIYWQQSNRVFQTLYRKH